MGHNYNNISLHSSLHAQNRGKIIHCVLECLKTITVEGAHVHGDGDHESQAFVQFSL